MTLELERFRSLAGKGETSRQFDECRPRRFVVERGGGMTSVCDS